MQILTIIFVFWLPTFGAITSTTVVDVPDVGKLRCNVNGDRVIEALGVAFAEPPTGQNRFRPPRTLPAGVGKVEIDATSYGPACLQPKSGTSHPVSEDCLSLNVWAPLEYEKLEAVKSLPVFVWIHGGGFKLGSGRDYNLSHMARQGIVAVSINYRLGGFGFLTSDDIRRENPDAPTNGGVNGLLDQVEALRWIMRHIGSFGGDPTKVTIAGESAGSLSTCIHLHMPITEGLFARAILESGSCLGPWQDHATSEAASNASREAMHAVNTSSVAGLRAVTAELLLGVFANFQAGPSPDGFFMPKNPSELPLILKNRQVIVGSNSMDTLFAPPYGSFGASLTVAKYESLVRDFFGEAGLALYPVPNADSDSVAKAFYTISSDVCNTCPKHWIAQKLVSANNSVYSYHFGYSRMPGFQGLACHGCELSDSLNGFMAGNPKPLFPGTSFIDTLNMSFDIQLAKLMSKAWVTFTQSGHPEGMAWPSHNGDLWKATFLNITTTVDGAPHVHVDHGLAAERCTFFDGFVAEGSEQNQKYMDFCIAPWKTPSNYEDVAEKATVLV